MASSRRAWTSLRALPMRLCRGSTPRLATCSNSWPLNCGRFRRSSAAKSFQHRGTEGTEGTHLLCISVVRQEALSFPLWTSVSLWRNAVSARKPRSEIVLAGASHDHLCEYANLQRAGVLKGHHAINLWRVRSAARNSTVALDRVDQHLERAADLGLEAACADLRLCCHEPRTSLLFDLFRHAAR